MRGLKTIPLVFFLAVMGCKSMDHGGTTLSLNNLARGADQAVTRNDCHGSFEVIPQEADLDKMIQVSAPGLTDAAKHALQEETLRALSAVPTPLQFVFFGVGGHIELTDQPAAICFPKPVTAAKDVDYKQFASEAGQTIESCWDANAQTDNLTIYIKADKAAIDHATVRSFGYVWTQALRKLDFDGATNKVVASTDTGAYENTALNLAVTFLNDVKKNPKFDLHYYQGMVGAEALANPASLSLTNMQQRVFMDYVFAESFDSYYCSGTPTGSGPVNIESIAKTTTYREMHDDFPATYLAFRSLAMQLEGLSFSQTQLSGATAAAASTPSPAPSPASSSTPVWQPQTGGMQLLGFIGGVFNGIGRIGAGIVRGVGQVGGAVIRGTGQLAVGAGRFLVNGSAAVLRGAGQVIVGGAQVVGQGVQTVGGWIVGGTQAVGQAVLGPSAYQSQQGAVYSYPSTTTQYSYPNYYQYYQAYYPYYYQ